MIGSRKIADIVMVARRGQVRCMRTGFEIFMQDIFIQPAGHTFATKQRQISLDSKYKITLQSKRVLRKTID